MQSEEKVGQREMKERKDEGEDRIKRFSVKRCPSKGEKRGASPRRG